MKRLALVTTSLSGAAHAAETGGGMPLGAMLQSFFALLLVLGVIAGAAWLLKRAQQVRGTTSANVLKTVAAIGVGTKERVVIVEVADTWLVLGVAPGQVRPLHTLPKQTLPEANINLPKFSDWLARAKSMTAKSMTQGGPQ